MAHPLKFRSSFERRIAEDLSSSSTAFHYEKATFTFTRACRYLTDFVIQGPSGPIYIEAKGYFPSADRTKMLLVRDQNPDIDIRLLFQRSSNTLNKKSKTTYGDWATKHGFVWAEGTQVPLEWLS